MTVVAEEDKSRSIWPSCPALGWTKGVDMLTSRPLPNTNATAVIPTLAHPLNTPNSGTKIETHGPYQHGTGFSANNDPIGQFNSFNPNIPIKLPYNHADDAGFVKYTGAFVAGGDLDSANLTLTAAETWCSANITCAGFTARVATTHVEVGKVYFKSIAFIERNTDGNWSSYIKYKYAGATGPGYPSVFASEFGCVVMSSFESMSATLPEESWSLHGGMEPDDCSQQSAQTCPIRQCEAKGASSGTNKGKHNPMYGARFSAEIYTEDAIEASRRVTNGTPLGCSLLSPVGTVNFVQTRKVVSKLPL
jgi:hypothetical protein